jgi:hypothetical protein
MILSTTDLEELIEFGNDFQFRSDAMDGLVQCCRVMRRIRRHVIMCQWDTIAKIVNDPDLIDELAKYPQAPMELAFALREVHNHRVAASLEASLESPHLSGRADMHSISVQTRSQYADLIAALTKEVATAESEDITDATTRNLLEIARQVLALRCAQRDGELAAVSEALQWLQSRWVQCPRSVQKEIDSGHLLLSNILVQQDLQKSLSNGMASGFLDFLDINTVETAQLAAALKKADELGDSAFEDVARLKETSKLILKLRSSQLAHNDSETQEAISLLSSQQKLDPLVIDEVATARSEFDNRMTVGALTNALQAFSLGSATEGLTIALLGLAELQHNGVLSVVPVSGSTRDNQQGDKGARGHKTNEDDDSESPRSGADLDGVEQPSRALEEGGTESESSSYESSFIAQYQAQFAGMLRDFADCETIDAAIVEAEKHGAFTHNGTRFYRTAKCIAALRRAVRQGQWGEVEAELERANNMVLTGQVTDSTADLEFHVYTLLARIRTATRDCRHLLDSGWCSCCAGVVHAESIELESLNAATRSLEQSVTELLALASHSRESSIKRVALSRSKGSKQLVTPAKVTQRRHEGHSFFGQVTNLRSTASNHSVNAD